MVGTYLDASRIDNVRSTLELKPSVATLDLVELVKLNGCKISYDVSEIVTVILNCSGIKSCTLVVSRLGYDQNYPGGQYRKENYLDYEGDINVENLKDFEIIKSTHYGKKTFVNILLFRGAAR